MPPFLAHVTSPTRDLSAAIAGASCGADGRIWAQLWPILQDVHQLRSFYGKRAGTSVSNAAVLQLLGVNDTETAELDARTIDKKDAR